MAIPSTAMACGFAWQVSTRRKCPVIVEKEEHALRVIHTPRARCTSEEDEDLSCAMLKSEHAVRRYGFIFCI